MIMSRRSLISAALPLSASLMLRPAGAAAQALRDTGASSASTGRKSMHASFGPIRQMGYVVRDLDAAMHAWADRLGVGPWFYVKDLTLAGYRFRGTEYPDFKLSIAQANSGDMQLELIEQRCDHPSLYLEFLKRHGEGLQHVCVWPKDYDASLAQARANGLAIAQEGRLGPVRFVYYEDVHQGGTSLEMSELLPGRLPGIERIRAAAVDWDGSDPIRPLIR